jgi:hypothetical protein
LALETTGSEPPESVSEQPNEAEESHKPPEGAPDDEGSSDPATPKGSARAIFHVNVNLDSSLDTEKLQKQLELLKHYGAI